MLATKQRQRVDRSDCGAVETFSTAPQSFYDWRSVWNAPVGFYLPLFLMLSVFCVEPVSPAASETVSWTVME